MAPIFVTPSTTWAISGPKSSAMRSGVVSVSSTTSCSKPEETATTSSFMSARRFGNLERMNEIRLAGVADLALVLEGREHVGAPEQLEIGVRTVAPHLLEQGFNRS